MNTKYGSVDENGVLEYADDYVTVGGQTHLNPTAAQYRAVGKYPVEDAPPAEPALQGFHYEAGVWRYRTKERQGVAVPVAVERVYDLVADPAPTLADFDDAMEDHLRREREARGYTTREPDAYLTSAVPRWSQDAEDWVAHRDDVMGYALALINAVQAGERQPPTMSEFEAGLPRIEWTYQEEA